MNLKNSKTSNTLVGVFVPDINVPEFLNECFYSLALQEHPVDVLIMHSSLTDDQIGELKAIAESPIINVRFKDENGETQTREEGAGNSMNYAIEKIDASNFADVFNHLFQTAKSEGYEVLSVMEPEDIVLKNWFSLVNDWRKENPSIAVFSPIIEQNVGGAFTNYLNEACWAEGLAEEAGKYDNNLLLRFNFALNPLGAAFIVDNITKEEDVIEITEDGTPLPMKRSIKLFNYYEFFIRLTYNDLKIMNIPRVGYELRIVNGPKYNHTSCKIPQNILQLPVDKGGVSQDEAQFWAKYATDAYFMETDDPNVEFKPQEVSV